jgi:hypothetical protein
MANVEKWGVTWLQVVLDGSGDWTCSKAIKLKSLKFMPSAPGDILVLKEVTLGKVEALWPQIKLSSSSGDPVGCMFNGSIATKLTISFSSCTLSNPLNAIITFDFI